LGSKTKTNQHNGFKQLREIEKRLDILESSQFHGLLRSEAMINLLLNTKVADKEAFNEEIKKIFEAAQSGTEISETTPKE